MPSFSRTVAGKKSVEGSEGWGFYCRGQMSSTWMSQEVRIKG